MVTKTKLGLLCAALMMILGTQSVDAQRIRVGGSTHSDASAPHYLNASQKASERDFKSNAPEEDGCRGSKNQAPRRAAGTLTADATHAKSWYQGHNYTWTDANNVSHTANYLDVASDPYQVYGFLYDLYSNPSIPGIHYSGVDNDTLSYRFPWGIYKEYTIYDGQYYYDDDYITYIDDLGWGYAQYSGGYGPVAVQRPVENGYTVCLVKLKDDYNIHYEEHDKADLIAYMDSCIESVQLLTDGLRVAEGGTQAGTLFTYTGDLNRFFFIGKGKSCNSYSFDAKSYEQIGNVTFSGTSGSLTLRSPWSGSVNCYTGGYYLSSGRSITYTIPSGVSNAEITIVINTANSSYGDGYFKINGNIYQAVHGTDNTYTLPGTFSTGNVITIMGCTASGGNSADPDMSAAGIQVYKSVFTKEYFPTMYTNNVGDPDEFWVEGFPPFYDMFEEFSAQTIQGSDLSDFYPSLAQGVVKPILHDCDGVIRRDHAFSMSAGTDKKSVSNLVLYIPDHRAMEGIRTYDTIHPNLRPQVGLYTIELEAEASPNQNQLHKYDVTVDWTSNLDNITSSTVPQDYELHAYWTDPDTGVEHDVIIYTGTNTQYTYQVSQSTQSYTINYKVKGIPHNATNPDEFYAWSNVDNVIIPGFDDFFMLDRDHFESDFVITSEMNFYRNYLYPKNKDEGGYTPLVIENGMKHFVLYRQSTDDGVDPVPVADLYFETVNGRVYYKIEYREGTQHPISNNNN